MTESSAVRVGGAGLSRGLVVALFAAYAFNTLDRQALGILLEPIRLDLHLSDVQLGVLTGITFALVFAIASIPMALWSSFGNRRMLVAVSVLFWSAMMVVGGFAMTFWQLVLARAGLALGEAGSVPTSHAILSDAASENTRTGTLAVFTSAAPVGVFGAFLLGGVFGHFLGWRSAVMAAGILGCVVGLYLLLFTRDVPHGFERSTSAKKALDLGNFRLAAREIWSDAGARYALIATFLHYIVLNASLVWYPSFLIRIHGFSVLQAASILAIGSLLGMAGTLWFGRLIDRLSIRTMAWRAWVPALSILLTTPVDLVFLLSPNRVVSIVALGVTSSVTAIMIAPTIAILHSAVAPAHRALASAILLSGGSLIGAGLGPSAIGWLSGVVFSDTGAQSLRYALVWMQIFGVSASGFYFLSGRFQSAGTRPMTSTGSGLP